jgi:hypothetical protein
VDAGRNGAISTCNTFPAKDASVNQTIGPRLAIKFPGASLAHSKSMLVFAT